MSFEWYSMKVNIWSVVSRDVIFYNVVCPYFFHNNSIYFTIYFKIWDVDACIMHF